MGYLNETIESVSNRFKVWMPCSNVTDDIADLTIDYLNRARQWLESQKWSLDQLKTVVSITLNDSNQYDCPANLKTILEVYSDSTISGFPDIQFYEDHNDVAQRYTKLFVHDTATGGYWTLTFPGTSPYLSSLKMKYARFLDDYTGEGTEYSFFPGELLLRTGQKLFNEDSRLDDEQAQIIARSHAEMLFNYEKSIERNNQIPDLTPKDSFGRPIHIQGYALDGGSAGAGVHYPLSRAQAAGMHGF